MAKEALKISFQEVINWIFSADPIPENFIQGRLKLNSIVPYIQEQVWDRPELAATIAEVVNDLYKIPDSIDLLLYYRDLFKKRGIQKHHLWKYIPKRTPDNIQKLQDIENLGENDARGRSKMMTLLNIDDPLSLEVKQDPKNADNIKDVSIALKGEEKAKEKKLSSVVNTNLYLSHVDQEIIDEMELTLFDVKLLKKRNEILMTFIDKYHHKKYYLTPFEASIYLSKSNSIIKNDYLMKPEDGDFIEYVITDWQLLNRLKFAMNANYKSAINLQGE